MLNKLIPEKDNYSFNVLDVEKTVSQKGRPMAKVQLEMAGNDPVESPEGGEVDPNETKTMLFCLADGEGLEYSSGFNALLRGVGFDPIEAADFEGYDVEALKGANILAIANSEKVEKRNRDTGELVKNPHTGEGDMFIRINIAKIWSR